MSQTQEQGDPNLINSVLVELSVDEEGTVTGLDEDESGNEGAGTNPDKPRRKRWNRSPSGQNILCDQCDYKTKHYALLQRHYISKHRKPDQIVYKCSECEYMSVFKSDVTKHKISHGAEKKFACSQCDYKSIYRHCYVRHLKIHKETTKKQTKFSCDKCPFVTKYEGHITRHLAKIHNEVLEDATKCPNCEFSTKVTWRLNSHRNKNRLGKPIQCDFCNFSTSFRCAFKIHKQTHKGKLPKVTKEDLFDVFTQNPDFTPNPIEQPTNSQIEIDHSKQYTFDANSQVDWKALPFEVLQGDERLFKCTVCKYKSKFKASIQRHHYRLHMDMSEKPYKCINCDFATKLKDKMTVHTKRMLSKTVLVCTSCPYTSYFKCQLQIHHKQHNQFKCQYCEFTCKNHFDVQRHFNHVHAKEGLKCRFCDFTSPRREALISHEVTHTGVKAFQCKLCPYSCMRKGAYENHMDKHHGGLKKEIVYINASKIEQLKEDVKADKGPADIQSN